MGYPKNEYKFTLKDKRSGKILEEGTLWEESNIEARNYIKKQLKKDFIKYASIKIQRIF